MSPAGTLIHGQMEIQANMIFRYKEYEDKPTNPTNEEFGPGE